MEIVKKKKQTPHGSLETCKKSKSPRIFHLSIQFQVTIPIGIHVYSFNEYLLCTYWVPSTVVGTADIQVNYKKGVSQEADK